MADMVLSSVMEYGLENPLECEHKWRKPNAAGVSVCSKCFRESAMRTAVAVKVINNHRVNAVLTRHAEGYGDPYNATIEMLCEIFPQTYADAEESCDQYAEEEGKDRFIPFANNLKRHIPSKFDLNRLLTLWRAEGRVDPAGDCHVQAADMHRARLAFLQKYASWREGVMALRKLRKDNQAVRDHNASLADGEKKRQVRHPRERDHRKADIDMTDPRPMLRDRQETDRLFFSTKSSVEIRGEHRDRIKVRGVPESQIGCSIPEGLDVRSVSFRERTRHIREGMDPSRRLWEVRFSIRCLLPERRQVSDADEIVICADVGCKNHIATSQGELWSPPRQASSFRKSRVYQHQADSCFKNGSRKHKRIAQKAKNETAKRCRVKKSATQQKHAEIAAVADTFVMEDLNHKAMRLSAKGTKAKPGKSVVAKQRLNSSLQNAAMGQNQTLAQEACQNHGAADLYVPKDYTSKRCPKCGFTSPDNRITQAHFVCASPTCDYINHADVNATYNMEYIYKGGKGNLKPKGRKVVVLNRLKPDKVGKASLISGSIAPGETAPGNTADSDQKQATTAKAGPAAPVKTGITETEAVVKPTKKTLTA